MWPNPILLRAYLLRGALIWLGVRMIVAVIVSLAGGSPLQLSAATSLEVVAISVILGFVEFSRRRERALVANLGVSRLVLFWMYLFPASLGELGARAAAGIAP